MGGIEVLDSSLDAFAERLAVQNHTLKRALTDPQLFSGIGNAYSDEILHRARLSPIALTKKLSPAEVERLYVAVRDVLGILRAVYAADRARGASARRLARIRAIAVELNRATDLAREHPPKTLGHSAAWEAADRRETLAPAFGVRG